MRKLIRKLIRHENIVDKTVEGAVEIRPLGRGIVFLDGDYEGRYLDDVVEELNGGAGRGVLHVEIEWQPQADISRSL